MVFLIVWLTRKRFRTDGSSLLVYLAAFGTARFFMEFFRGQPALIAGAIPAAQVSAWYWFSRPSSASIGSASGRIKTYQKV